MNINKKKTYLNLFWGLVNKFLIIILGIFVPQIILKYMGSSTNGVLSTVNQIYGCITIIESGIGYATTQALYLPISRGDKNSINEILAATHIYYRRVGFIYLGLILILSFLFPYFGQSTLSVIEVREIVFLSGIGGVITFFAQGTFLLFLDAEGFTYISYNVTAVSTILTQITKIVLIVYGFSIVYVQLCAVLVQVSVMFFYYCLRKRKYKWLNYRVDPNFKAVEKKDNVFFHRICFFVFSNTDIVLISLFLSYAEASVYSIYSLLVSTVYSLVGLICTSSTFYWGQRYSCKDEFFGKKHLLFQKIYYMFVFAGNSILYVMALPFIRLYTDGVNDVNYLDNKLKILFIIVYTLQGLRVPNMTLTELAGHFKETQNHAVLESTINLTLSIILIRIMGIYGCLLGTIVAIIFRIIILVQYVSKKILFEPVRNIYMCWLKNFILSIISIQICSLTFPALTNWVGLFVMGIAVAGVVIVIFTVGNITLLKKVFKIKKASRGNLFDYEKK